MERTKEKQITDKKIMSYIQNPQNIQPQWDQQQTTSTSRKQDKS